MGAPACISHTHRRDNGIWGRLGSQECAMCTRQRLKHQARQQRPAGHRALARPRQPPRPASAGCRRARRQCSMPSWSPAHDSCRRQRAAGREPAVLQLARPAPAAGRRSWLLAAGCLATSWTRAAAAPLPIRSRSLQKLSVKPRARCRAAAVVRAPEAAARQGPPVWVAATHGAMIAMWQIEDERRGAWGGMAGGWAADARRGAAAARAADVFGGSPSVWS